MIKILQNIIACLLHFRVSNGISFESLCRYLVSFFQWLYDFFPQRTESAKLIGEIKISSPVGFATRACFKNRGFKAGDTLVIKVIDKDNPDVWGGVSLKLGSVC